MKSTFVFGTVGSPISTSPRPGGSVGAIHKIAELGLGALELGWVQAVRVSDATCEQIHKAAQSEGIKISVHAPYFINLNANDEEWLKSRKRLMDAAHYGNLAGATDIVFHPGSYFGKKPSDVLPIAIPRLVECVKELRSKGNPVILRPETMGKIALLGSLNDCIELSKGELGIKPCIDFAHLHARAGDGSCNSYEEWTTILTDYAQQMGTESLSVLHIHLSGIRYSEKGERNHLPLLDSDFDLTGLLRALIDLNCWGESYAKAQSWKTMHY